MGSLMLGAEHWVLVSAVATRVLRVEKFILDAAFNSSVFRWNKIICVYIPCLWRRKQSS